MSISLSDRCWQIRNEFVSETDKITIKVVGSFYLFKIFLSKLANLRELAYVEGKLRVKHEHFLIMVVFNLIAIELTSCGPCYQGARRDCHVA